MPFIWKRAPDDTDFRVFYRLGYDLRVIRRYAGRFVQGAAGGGGVRVHRVLQARAGTDPVVHDRRAARRRRPRQPRPVVRGLLFVDAVVRGHAVVLPAGQRVAGGPVARLQRVLRRRNAVRVVPRARDQQQERGRNTRVAHQNLSDRLGADEQRSARLRLCSKNKRVLRANLYHDFVLLLFYSSIHT